MKYTPEMLAEAVRKATTYAETLRLLGIPVSGGAHVHIRRRIDQLGLDTSHFTGRGHPPGSGSPRQLTPDQILVVRPAHRRRAPGSLLTKALLAIGIPLRCARCGTGPQWNSQPLVLHVDHINGDPADCRKVNLRFLCPNCHSQTPTFAGRGKRERPPGLPPQRTSTPAPPPPMALTVARAAELLGVSSSHFYRLRARIAGGETDTPGHALAVSRERRDAAIIACALAFPAGGPDKIANRLRAAEHGSLHVAHGTVSNVLRRAGLAYRADRKQAVESRGDAAPGTP